MSSRDDATITLLTRFATACDGAFLSLSLAYFAATSWLKYVSSSAALRRIRDAPSARVSDLRSLLTSPSPSRLVVVRGQVQTKSAAAAGGGSWLGLKHHDALVAPDSRHLAVIVQKSQKCLYNNSWSIYPYGWSSGLQSLYARSWNDQSTSSLRSVPFVLVDGGKGPHSEFVHVSSDKSIHPLPLVLVYHELHPVETPWYSFVWSMFGHRYPVALLDEERILPVGKEITALGICRSQDGALEIKSCPELPYFLSDMTKDEIEADLTLDTKILFWGSVVLGSLSIGIMGYAIIRNWRRWKESRSMSQNQDTSSTEEQLGSNANEELNDVPEGELCVVCLARRRVCAFLPCGHRVCCQTCTIFVKTESRSPKCPVCRQLINSSVRIYNS